MAEVNTGEGFSNYPIILDAALDASPINNIEIQEHIAHEPKDLFKDRPSFEHIESTIRCEPGRAFAHSNYVHYLTLAWNNHLSVVISPDIVFYTILCEIASSVKADPETYRHLFTTSPDKVEIMAITHAPHVIDLDQLVQGIITHSPVDSQLFTAEFSTTTRESRLALQAAFCEAMSPYFHYTRTACGIPRVKVLGTKQDWQTLERKVHLLATEVFAQDISMEKSLSAYLSRAESVVRRIHSTRDVKFWQRMFGIDRCRSGHTDMVTGWIALLYKNGNGDLDHRSSGNDYYNYDSHISTVSWTCKETSKEFELRTGLLYSVINEGQDELDRKYPWFEPQFGHVVFDKNFKMTAEQFQQYIDTTLKGYDKKLFQNFFDVLKDAPMIIDKGPNELKQRLEIARRQLESWKKNCKDLQMDELDLEYSDFGDLISQSGEDKDKPVIEKFIAQLVEFLQTMKIPKIVMANGGVCANYEKQLLQAIAGNDTVEYLSASCSEESDGAMAALCEVLAHTKCRVTTLTVNGQRIKGEDLNLLANALIHTTAPIEHLQVTIVEGIALADAIFFLATKKSLKSFSIDYPSTYFEDEEDVQIEVMKRLYSAVRDSRSLEEVKIAYFGDRRRDSRSYNTCPIDVTEFYEDIAENLKLNSNLKSLTVQKWMYSPDLLTKMLSVPSLQRILFRDCDGFIPLEFLEVTKNLECLGGGLKLTPASWEKFSNFLVDPQCKLSTLNIGAKFDEETLALFTAGLINNKSLTSLNLDSMSFPEDTNLFETLLTAFKNGARLQDLSMKYMSKSVAGLEQLLMGLVSIGYKNLSRLITDLPIISEAGLSAVVQVLQLNQALEEFEVDRYGWGGKEMLKVTEEQETMLRTARSALPKLKKFGINGVRSPDD